MRLLFFYMLLHSGLVFSQDYITYTVEPGETVAAALPMVARYTYAEFQPGLVYFRDGVVRRANLNYSHLFGQMQFLKGSDTLYVDRVDDVKYIAVGNDTFYFQKYWVKQFARAGKIRLAEQRVLEFANKEKLGPYGGKSQGSIEAVQSIDNPGSIDKGYIAREVLIFAERNSYYFADRFGRFIVANKKNLIDLFGKSYPGFENFLSNSKPNYSRREDMLGVMNYLEKVQ